MIIDKLNIFTEPAKIETYRPNRRVQIETQHLKCEPTSSVLTWLKADPHTKYRSKSELPLDITIKPK